MRNPERCLTFCLAFFQGVAEPSQRDPGLLHASRFPPRTFLMTKNKHPVTFCQRLRRWIEITLATRAGMFTPDAKPPLQTLWNLLARLSETSSVCYHPRSNFVPSSHSERVRPHYDCDKTSGAAWGRLPWILRWDVRLRFIHRGVWYDSPRSSTQANVYIVLSGFFSIFSHIRMWINCVENRRKIIYCMW